ncbi:ABC transporter ATP-binding protein [Arthrobacter sp. 2MCAF14]|uniref:ABC transporter ATP-binding protein n=1 Tax=Arthrobacter sp. 2MCAF14 TaxID=3232982 RepID=UPI003F8DF98C
MLEIQGLRKEFVVRRNHVAAVNDLTFTVDEGELLVLLGSSGCGKTTTLRMVAGLEQASAGRISIGDKVVCDTTRRVDLSPNRRDVGMVFQSFALWPHMTVRRNIGYPLRARGLKQGFKEGWIDEAARMVDCTDLLDRYPGQLSGGQQQRVAVARALVARPSLLLFDEPLSNLDARLRDQLRNEIHQLHQRVGFTGLYVTHDQSEALALGDRLAIMRAGQIEQLGRPREVYENPATEFVAEFIGMGNSISLYKTPSGWASNSGQLVGRVPDVSAETANLRVRQQAIRLGTMDSLAPGEMGVEGGTIADVEYGGASVDVVVKFVDGRSVSSRIPLTGEGEHRFELGSRTTVIFSACDAKLFPTSPTGSAGTGQPAHNDVALEQKAGAGR